MSAGSDVFDLASQEIITYRARFPKPVFRYKVISVFGSNIVASEGAMWKKYRKIAAPAFSEKNNKLVWDETIRIMMDLFDNVWGDRSEVVVDHCVDLTLPIALFVISVAGRFGRRVTWTTDLVVPPDHRMTFKDALHISSTNLLAKLALPDWAKHLTERTRRVGLAFTELKQYMLEMVEARRDADKLEERYDLFSGLLDAAQDEPGNDAALSDDELIGNMFIFLFAGHEVGSLPSSSDAALYNSLQTTAHTLCFSFALLALYPAEQERLYQQIKGVMSSLNGMPAYEDMSRLTQSLAVFYETLRLFPPVTGIPKIAAQDTTLTVSNVNGEKTTFPVPSGTQVELHVPGLHYNPRYWKEPHKFMPERFLGDWPRDAFIPFSQGARACLGRRFFETEGVAIMTMLVSGYKIEVKEEPEFARETFDERYARITAFGQGITTTILKDPLPGIGIVSTSHVNIHIPAPSRPNLVASKLRSPNSNGEASDTHTTVFATAGQDAFAMVAFLAYFTAGCIIHVADAAAIKEITTYRARFPKPVFRYKVISVFGPNIVASEGDEWKKYRKIVAPAFSEKNNKLVWNEAIRIMMDLFDNVWGDRSEVVVDHCVDLTLPIALFVISAAGRFGRRVTWTTDLVVPPDHRMTFKDALHISSTNLLVKIALPDWAKYLTKHTRKVDLAFTELKQYMLEMVEARKDADKAEEHYDLFSGLLDAAQDEPGSEAALSDDELIGNMFIFLFAGHETTAHTLCFSFALLALYPAEQERLYQQIKGVMSSLNGMPAYEDMSRLTQSLAVFYETLRLFPPVTGIPKAAAQDTTLTVSNVNGGKTTFPVPSGTQVDLHAPGLHYNPRYWKEPHKFMPERFLGDWPRDAFIPFTHEHSAGARACLGRRFFETEAVAIVTTLISRYKIEVKEEPEFAGETFEERYARITTFKQGLTTTPLRVPLVFKRR
ncbi:Cytochrome P450 [Russula decolorans]